MGFNEEMRLADDILHENLDGVTVTLYADGDTNDGVEHKAIRYASRVEDLDLPGADKTQKRETVRWSILVPTITIQRGVSIVDPDGSNWKIYAVIGKEFDVSTLVVADRGGVYRHGAARVRPLSGGPIQ